MIIIPKPITPLPAIKPGLVAWGKSTDPNNNGTILSDAASISNWLSKSRNISIAQANATKRPVYDYDSLQGNPTIAFNGVDQSFQISGLDTKMGSTDVTMYFLHKPSNNGTNWLLDTNAGGTRLIVSVASVTATSTFVNYTYSADWQVLSIVLNSTGNLMTVYKNGASAGTAAYAGRAFSATTGIGGDAAATFGRYQGNIAEFMLYRGAHSDTDRVDLQRYLGNYAGVSVP
jgi:hypothetical protein